jgi:tRNA A-37 threonylcarbamoyl transferase component Bud32
MNTKRICSTCGKPVEANAPEGLCPDCLMKAAIGTGVDLGKDTQSGAPSPSLVPPTIAELAAIFPQLEILELIGKGGMGAVYKARQKQLDRIVALKILPPGIGDEPAFAERFAREAKALAKLNHPNIVTLYEFGDANGQFYFLMEFVDGVNLRQLLHAARVSAREALAIVPQICDALQFAHDQGIVHRDIKPENILLDRRGRVKVADFGLAKIVGNDGRADLPVGQGGVVAQQQRPATELTDAGRVMGTPQYMSPEQIQAPGEVDHRADIYALGVVFYQMLTGELPGKKLEPPSKKVSIDVRLDEIVLRALEKKPELRYQQASVLKTQVETIASSSGHDLTGDRQNRRAIPVLRWRDRWIWDTGNVVLLAMVPGMPSIIAASVLMPFFGAKALMALIPCAMGLFFALIYGFVGNRVRRLKAGLAQSDAEVAEALFFERPRKTPGIAVLHDDRLELFGVAMIRHLVIPLDEIASVSEVRMFNGKMLWSKRGFVLDLKNGRRIGVAVPEPFGQRWRAKLSGGSLPEISDNKSGQSDVPARFSRTAVVGACWSPFFFIAFILMFTVRHVQTGEYHGPSWWQVLLMFALLLPGITAPFGTTILGWMAVAQIRRSAGKLYGLWLAVFDGLLFPLLALDGGIIKAGMSAVDYLAGWLTARNQYWESEDFFGLPIRNSYAIVVIWTLVVFGICAVIDWLIVRRVWRAVNKGGMAQTEKAKSEIPNQQTKAEFEARLARAGRRWRDAFGSTPTLWCLYLEKNYYQFTLSSPLAIRLTNLSKLGFIGWFASLGFLGFLSPEVPDTHWLFGLFGLSGFFGFFGLIGFVYSVEMRSRRKQAAALHPSSSSSEAVQTEKAESGNQDISLAQVAFFFAITSFVIPTAFWWLQPWILPRISTFVREFMIYLTPLVAILAVVLGLISRKSRLGWQSFCVGAASLAIWLILFIGGNLADFIRSAQSANPSAAAEVSFGPVIGRSLSFGQETALPALISFESGAILFPPGQLSA